MDPFTSASKPIKHQWHRRSIIESCIFVLHSQEIDCVRIRQIKAIIETLSIDVRGRSELHDRSKLDSRKYHGLVNADPRDRDVGADRRLVDPPHQSERWVDR